MKYYTDLNNSVYAYASDGSQDDFITADKIAITEEEAKVLSGVITQVFIDSLSYRQKRQSEYPLINEQLDALYHAGVFPPDMASKIKAVKDKYPKV
jgi:hypothetical protein